MKPYYTVYFCLIICFSAAAQDSASKETISSIHFSPVRPVKATVHLNNDNAITGMITNFNDSTVEMSMDSQYTRIPIEEIKRIKIKRHAVTQGMTEGAAVTGILGYGLGYIFYEHNYSISDEENKENQQAKGFLGALIGLAPGTIIGGIVGGISKKRNFTIDGNKENIRKMIRKIW